MDVRVVGNVSQVPADGAVVLPVFEGDDPGSSVPLSEGQRSLMSKISDRGVAMSRLYEKSLLPGDSGSPDVLLIGSGSRSAFDALTASRVAGAAALYLNSQKYRAIAFAVTSALAPRDEGYAIVDGAISASSGVGLSRSGSHDESAPDILLVGHGDQNQDLEDGAGLGRIVGESRNIARELVNLPPNVINPSTLAERAKNLARDNGLEYEALDESQLAELKMGSLLGVAAGSRQPPRLIVMRYGDANSDVKLAVVGKGLTFDSGGLSLKTHEGMETMKSDMSGAAAVIGGMVAIASLQPRGISVTGYVGATENMPGGRAMRPGDILTAMNGKTIEVLNTDAEGRLVLADVLAYAVQQGATRIVDFATLTGAAAVSLGDAASLATGKPMDWVREVVAAADEGLDRAWPMPQYREYRQAMDSDFADLKNSGSRGGGALNAAAFLSEFVADVPWTHMDIAGTAYSRDGKPYRPKGATGVGVGTIVRIVQHLSTDS